MSALPLLLSYRLRLICACFFIGGDGEIRLSQDKSCSARTRAPKQSTGLFLSLSDCPVRISRLYNKKTNPKGFAFFIGGDGEIRTRGGLLPN